MKKLFALLTLILTAATLARSGRDGERAYLYDPLPVILPEGINHLLDNSQSELEEDSIGSSNGSCNDGRSPARRSP